VEEKVSRVRLSVRRRSRSLVWPSHGAELKFLRRGGCSEALDFPANTTSNMGNGVTGSERLMAVGGWLQVDNRWSMHDQQIA